MNPERDAMPPASDRAVAWRPSRCLRSRRVVVGLGGLGGLGWDWWVGGRPGSINKTGRRDKRGAQDIALPAPSTRCAVVLQLDAIPMRIARPPSETSATTRTLAAQARAPLAASGRNTRSNLPNTPKQVKGKVPEMQHRQACKGKRKQICTGGDRRRGRWRLYNLHNGRRHARRQHNECLMPAEAHARADGGLRGQGATGQCASLDGLRPKMD